MDKFISGDTLYVKLSQEDIEKILKEKFGESIENVSSNGATFEVKLTPKEPSHLEQTQEIFGEMRDATPEEQQQF